MLTRFITLLVATLALLSGCASKPMTAEEAAIYHNSGMALQSVGQGSGANGASQSKTCHVESLGGGTYREVCH